MRLAVLPRGRQQLVQRNEDQALMKAHGVQIESWGPFAEGRNDMFHNEILTSIARKYNKSVAQVVLRWLTQRGVVAIPKLYIVGKDGKIIAKDLRGEDLREKIDELFQ